MLVSVENQTRKRLLNSFDCSACHSGRVNVLFRTILVRCFFASVKPIVTWRTSATMPPIVLRYSAACFRILGSSTSIHLRHISTYLGTQRDGGNGSMHAPKHITRDLAGLRCSTGTRP